MSRFTLAAALLFFYVAPMTYARDVYVIGMHARGTAAFCSWLVWSGDIMFYNTAATEQLVRVVAVSNGALSPSGHDEIVVPPMTAISQQMATGSYWYPKDPLGLAPLWMWRLEVPDSVRVQSVMQLTKEFCTPSLGPDGHGQITLPTFDRLVPAGEEQIFLGTDLGELGRRVNVGLYNASLLPSNGQLRLHRACDNAVVATAMIAVPPNTTLQAQLQSGLAPVQCPASGAATGTYVTVTLDQPGLAFVSVLSNGDVPRLTHNFVRP